MAQMLEAALKYAAQGYKIFPCAPLSKKPATPRGFHDATDDPAQIRRWWAENPDYNIAFSPHTAGLGVIDLDPPDGWKAWQEFCRGHANYDDATFTICTPRGGRHLYYRGELPTSVRKLVPGKPIDTRGRGSYALLPPSRTPDGGYSILYSNDPAPLPWHVQERVLAMAQERVTTPFEGDLDTPTSLDRARQYLRSLPPVIEGHGSDQAVYDAACMLKDLGISAGKAVGLLMADLTFHPAPDLWWIEEKVTNAYSYAQNTPGSKTVDPAAPLLANVAPPPQPPGPIPFNLLLKASVAGVREIIPGLIERDIVTFLAGAGGSHKSRTALHWGLAIASGTPVYGRPTDKTPFLYLSYEDHPDEVTRRTQAICRQMGVADLPDAEFWDLTLHGHPLAVITEAGVTEHDFCGQVRAHLQARPGHKFMVIDTCYNALQFIGAAKIDEALVKAGIEFLSRLGRECDTTILVLWHPSQAGQERGDASGWSVAWHNTPRARLSLSPDKNQEGAFILKTEKRNNAARGEPLSLVWNNGMLAPMPAEARQEADHRVLEAVREIISEGERTGQYLTRNGKVMKWMRDMAQHAAPSRRVTDELVRDMAAHLERLGEAQYIPGHSHTAAGYRLVVKQT